ncbi:MAG: hypothetical protein ACRDKI_11765 [Solirubrobacterales bacterium]
MKFVRPTNRWIKERLSALSGDQGFTMIPAITAVFVGSLISLGAWTAAQADLGLQNTDRYSKTAYSQAESGVTDYVQHMAEDAGFWQYCDDPPGISGDGVGQTAVNDTDRGGSSGNVRRWLPQPTAGSTQDLAVKAQYSIDLIPTNGFSRCKDKSNRAETMVDKTTGVIRIRVTGRAGPPPPASANIATWRNTKWKRRSVVIEFRRKGFLDYAYFTDKEGADPVLQGTAQKTNCATYYSPPVNAANSLGRFYWNNKTIGGTLRPECTEIRFADSDFLGGPFHTNDAVLMATNGGPEFGNAGKNDVTEVFDDRCPFRVDDTSDHNIPKTLTDSGNTTSGNCPTNSSGAGSTRPVLNGPLLIGAAAGFLPLPETNEDLKIYADPTNVDTESQGYTFYGTTKITMAAGQITVTNANVNGGTATPMDYPPSGVIFVDNEDSVASCDYNPSSNYPSLPAGCALLELKGTYDTPLTVTSAADIVITGDVRKDASSDTAVLGMIGENFVRVRHYANTTCGNTTNTSGNPRVNYIDGAILTLKHSFIVDQYACGSSLGTLHISGVLAQEYRGTVGTGNGTTGYLKDYRYDYRYKYLTPPHFLVPTLSTWRISRYREQVPSCTCT